jgi:hypothetical protein
MEGGKVGCGKQEDSSLAGLGEQETSGTTLSPGPRSQTSGDEVPSRLVQGVFSAAWDCQSSRNNLS